MTAKEKIIFLLIIVFLFSNCGNGGAITFLDYSNRIDSKTDTIEVTYITWACACANWIDIDYLSKNSYISDDKLAENCFFIEAEERVEKISKEYHVGLNGNRIILIGSFYKDKGISRDYEKPITQKPEHAKVFRYTEFEIIKPYSIYKTEKTDSVPRIVIIE